MKIILFLLFSMLFLNANEKLKDVSLQLLWKHQFQFAGYYIAKEKGFYKDAGLNVKIKEFSSGINIADNIVSGKSEFGVGRPSLIIDKVNKDKDILLLAAIYQHSPFVLHTKKRPDIKTLADIKGKKIMPTSDASIMAAINAMLLSNNIKSNDFKIIKHSFNADDIISQKTDLMASYISNEPFLLKEKGIESTIFSPKDYGFDFYGDLLFTSSEYEKNNPKTVNKFYYASLKGWKYAFSHIDEAVKIILNKYNTQNKSKKALLYEAKTLKKLALVNDIELGNLNIYKLGSIANTYFLLQLMQHKQIDLSQIIYKPKKEFYSSLTQKEIDYLKQKKELSVCISCDRLPIEDFDEDGKLIGINHDILEIFKKKLSISFKIVKTSSWKQSIKFIKEKKCDILPLIIQTEKRKKYLNFTTPYTHLPFVLATKPDITFINNLKILTKQKIGIPKQYALIEFLKNKYPNINIVEIKNIKVGLEKILNNELDGVIGSLISVGYLIQKDFIGQLKISGKLDNKFAIRTALRNDDKLLLKIFNKIIYNTDKIQQRKILNSWLAIGYEKNINYKLIWGILFTFFIIFFIFIYRQNFLKQQIKEKIKENTMQLETLQQQEKLASMGEMIGSIAHQWRQPLNAISISIQNLDDDYEDGLVNKKFIDEFIDKNYKIIKFMSKTIDDFRNFYRVKKDKEIFSIKEAINNAIFIQSAQLKNYNIKLLLNEKDFKINGYKNEFQHAILNIINNAKDAILEKEIKNGTIKITIKNRFIFIENNAGGIDADVIQRIFEPYFTTKEQEKGTGMGLYISKMIIEDNLNGMVCAKNIKGGTRFIIGFKDEEIF